MHNYCFCTGDVFNRLDDGFYHSKQVLEKLYKAIWGLEGGVGSIIMSPTRELADQLGKLCRFSVGLVYRSTTQKTVDGPSRRAAKV
ncbi:putative RNA helicase [Helianthus anomalus]